MSDLDEFAYQYLIHYLFSHGHQELQGDIVLRRLNLIDSEAEIVSVREFLTEKLPGDYWIQAAVRAGVRPVIANIMRLK